MLITGKTKRSLKLMREEFMEYNGEIGKIRKEN
jgi:hypothetical protein